MLLLVLLLLLGHHECFSIRHVRLLLSDPQAPHAQGGHGQARVQVGRGGRA
jgi:hypothetical protein